MVSQVVAVAEVAAEVAVRGNPTAASHEFCRSVPVSLNV